MAEELSVSLIHGDLVYLGVSEALAWVLLRERGNRIKIIFTTQKCTIE